MKTEGVNKELIIDSLEGLGVSYELSKSLKWAIENRKKRYTQEDIARLSGKSLSSIKRFENGKVDSLFLYCLYREMFGINNPF